MSLDELRESECELKPTTVSREERDASDADDDDACSEFHDCITVIEVGEPLSRRGTLYPVLCTRWPALCPFFTALAVTGTA